MPLSLARELALGAAGCALAVCTALLSAGHHAIPWFTAPARAGGRATRTGASRSSAGACAAGGAAAGATARGRAGCGGSREGGTVRVGVAVGMRHGGVGVGSAGARLGWQWSRGAPRTSTTELRRGERKRPAQRAERATAVLRRAPRATLRGWRSACDCSVYELGAATSSGCRVASLQLAPKASLYAARAPVAEEQQAAGDHAHARQRHGCGSHPGRHQRVRQRVQRPGSERDGHHVVAARAKAAGQSGSVTAVQQVGEGVGPVLQDGKAARRTTGRTSEQLQGSRHPCRRAAAGMHTCKHARNNARSLFMTHP